MSNASTGCMFFIARSHIAPRGVLTRAIGIAFYFDDSSGVPLVVFLEFLYYMTIVVGDFFFGSASISRAPLLKF